MKLHYLFYAFLLLLCLNSCDKGIAPDDADRKEFFIEDGIKYTLKNGEAIVLGYDDNSPQKKLKIYSGILFKGENYKVTQIADNAFSGHQTLVSLTIPKTVKYIGTKIFAGCNNLSEIVIDKENQNFCVYEGIIFSKDTTTLIACPNTKQEYSVPSVTSTIRDYAFMDCNRLTNVKLSNSTKKVGKGAFYNCKLTAILIPEKCTTVETEAFVGCPIETVTINSSTVLQNPNITFAAMFGNGVKTCNINCNTPADIASNMFARYKSLTNLTLSSNSLKSIGNNAFEECVGLSSLSLPSSLITIGENAFRKCIGLTSVVVPKNVNQLGFGAFFGCSKLKSATLPDGITSLSDAIFHDCISLTSVNIPLNCTKIGKETFWNCNITSIRIPAKVTTIGWQAFYDCNNLSNVTCLAQTPPTCEGGPFSCLQTLHVPSGCKTKYQNTLYWKDFKSIVEDAK